MLRVIAFGILWFFITLSVESSIIPLPMLINEYRVYLPSSGLFLSITTGAFLLSKRFKIKNALPLVLSFFFISLLFSYATYGRNVVWRSTINLWEDVIRKSPKKAEGYYILAKTYLHKGQTDKAIELLKTALTSEPYNAVIHLYYFDLALAYKHKGLFNEAIKQYLFAINLKPDYVEAHNNLGLLYISEGRFVEGVRHLQTALELNPNCEAYNNLGLAYASIGRFDKAIEYYRTALRLKPDSKIVRDNLNSAYRFYRGHQGS